ncbi:type II secretion system minor pseudopilin GspK [Pollutimonas bauzanensis]|uniref:Type II secretion system protein K n=1 Tax=Pollutimonas bauzanensis TaxID=658167 RepID=A0A1M5NUC1_9BURK|nr:type II secretion system minor pseudopilin GspK [Pollutimonas bauzanensis]SHG93078.1 general secretion pathway protein K [Pollutimonas bauzanensis]
MTRLQAFRQRGMAVIGALLVVAAASIAATAIVERQALLARTLIGERDRAQAKWLLRSGLDWSRVILRYDARRSPITHKDAMWAQPIAGLEISPPGDARQALFSGRIEDEQGKYNLRNLAIDGVVQPQELLVLERLLGGLNIPASVAASIAERVADSQASQERSALAPGLRGVGDLRGLDGVTPGMVDILAPYLTVLPEKTTVNANTASAEVLSANLAGLPLAEARALAGQRDRGQWFNSLADFTNRLGNPEVAPGGRIGVNSDWFRVAGEVTLDRSVVGMQALLHRQGSRAPVIVWIRD